MDELVPLSSLFSIEYGNQLDKNKLIETQDGVNLYRGPLAIWGSTPRSR